jgi:nucleotide-binding universal stress UspA family protein
MADAARRILVGFDGSAESKRALRWAAELAYLTRCEVQAINAWDFPAYYDYPEPFEGWDTATKPHEEFDATVEQIDVNRRPIRLSLDVMRGDPAKVLIEESSHATMLVVGSRGLGGFTSLMMGSVSSKCVRHSACPVLVVRGTQELHPTATPTESG